MEGSRGTPVLAQFRRGSRTRPSAQLELLGTPRRSRLLQRFVAAAIVVWVMYGFLAALDEVTVGVQRYFAWAFAPEPEPPVIVDIHPPAPPAAKPAIAADPPEPARALPPRSDAQSAQQ